MIKFSLSELSPSEKQWLSRVRRQERILDKAFLTELIGEQEQEQQQEFDESAERARRVEKMARILAANVPTKTQKDGGIEYDCDKMEVFLKSIFDDGVASGEPLGYSLADMV